ncbi:MAG: cobyric acid synthase [Zoogloeaceae bacterium]|nr:cobyric acid synthase [Zoogloeaceae bacterium]
MTRALMIQGTASNAGKSLLTAALCRIFKQDGWRVAPFKSQNMALNSFVTPAGGEIGRAQAMQAEAAGVVPDVRMNPVLLKPTGDAASQVILHGKALPGVRFGNLSARDYYATKARLRGEVEKAYRSLAQDYELIVIEGAGSPAEINLNEGDFVNMGMAKIADAPVLLVGDIDKGGVFAAFYGTVKLLPPEDQARIKGLIVNKFRGDADILKPGLEMIEERLDLPVLGVVPYARLDIDDEDSVSARLEAASLQATAEPAAIDIAVIWLAHMSNFTDFSPLERMPGVRLRYVDAPHKLGAPDLLIVPGSKNTQGDLQLLRQTGMAAAIERHARQGVPVFGICGGYQMLGERLRDPDGVEAGGEMPGLGLLPVETVLRTEKTTTQVKGVVAPLPGLFAPLSGIAFAGYEIHMGESRPTRPEGSAFAQLDRGGQAVADGLVAGHCAGTYAHGLFESGPLCAALINLLRAKKGLPADTEVFDHARYKEAQYDELARIVRQSLDMERIYEIVGIK